MVRRGVLAAVIVLALGTCREPRPAPVLVATTTSVENAGLLDAIRTAFLEETGIELDAFVVGSGKALRMAREGRVDVAITHEPRGEAELLASGRVVEQRPFLENRFLLAGPVENPAAIGSRDTVLEGMRKVHQKRARFVSRGDESGTHARERELWRVLGIDPRENPRYQELGQGMGALLRSANELRAYALSDEATFARFEDSLQLTPVATTGDGLRNIYTITLVQRNGGEVNSSASDFFEWLKSSNGVRAVERFTRAKRGFRLPQVLRKGIEDPG